MKKNNALIIIFILVVLLAVVIVLLATTVFIVRSVEVESAVDTDLVSEESIIKSSGISLGRSIISINKSHAKEIIEKDNPYLEVTSIVRKFPNKVVIKVDLRTAVMCIKSADGIYAAIVDSDLKVLNVMPYVDAENTGATIISNATFDVSEQGISTMIGRVIPHEEGTALSLVQKIVSAASSEQIDLSGKSFCTFVTNITVKENDSKYFAEITTNTGVKLVVDTSLHNSIAMQLYMCLYVYNSEVMQVDKTKGYIFYDRSSSTPTYVWKEHID